MINLRKRARDYHSQHARKDVNEPKGSAMERRSDAKKAGKNSGDACDVTNGVERRYPQEGPRQQTKAEGEAERLEKMRSGIRKGRPIAIGDPSIFETTFESDFGTIRVR